MDFIREFKTLAEQMIEQKRIAEARGLLEQFHKLGFQEDGDIICFWARLYELEGDGAASRTCLEKGWLRYPRCQEIRDRLFALYEWQEEDFSEAFYRTEKRLVVFRAEDNVLGYLADQFIRGLRARGHTVLVFDIGSFAVSAEKLMGFQKEGVDAVFTFNNMGFLLKADSGEVLWDVWQVPCFNYLVDHPMYYYDSLDEAPETGIVLCADKNHVDYVKRFYQKVNRCRFLPTGGEKLETDYVHTWEAYQRRKIEVLYIGSNKYHDEIEEDDFYREVFHDLHSNPQLTAEEVIEAHARKERGDLTEEELKQIIQQYRFVDTNVNSYYRYLVLKSLVEAGIPVTVYGVGWERTDIFNNENFLFKGLIPFQEGISLMKESKVVLNNMAWFKDGASEKIFNGMLQGAVCVTDSSQYLLEQFKDGKELVFYSLEDLKKLPGLVQEILNHPRKAFAIAQAGEKCALAEHCWKHRVDRLI